jgi:hypothetical protein
MISEFKHPFSDQIAWHAKGAKVGIAGYFYGNIID